MKKYSILILVLLLTAALFTGCGCRNSRPAATTPTTLPTNPVTTAPTQSTTHATTEATHAPTNATEGTIENGNGPLPTNETTTHNGTTENGTEGAAGAEGRARHIPQR